MLANTKNNIALHQTPTTMSGFLNPDIFFYYELEHTFSHESNEVDSEQFGKLALLKFVSVKHKTNSVALHREGLWVLRLGSHVVDTAWQENRKGRWIFSSQWAVYFVF